MKTWDAIVIGSAIGGLSAAVVLARRGRSVLVLEQHYLPGGWSHSFTLEGHTFSPGVHYVGEIEEGRGLRRVLEGLGAAHATSLSTSSIRMATIISSSAASATTCRKDANNTSSG